jgi:hypothetical protein
VKLAETREVNGGEIKGLSVKTIREVRNVMHVALKRAVKTKLIPHNPGWSL